MKDKPPDMNILIGNTPIGRTDVHKFLGVHIDEKYILVTIFPRYVLSYLGALVFLEE